jgi:hypothetical protein
MDDWLEPALSANQLQYLVITGHNNLGIIKPCTHRHPDRAARLANGPA